jgi:hypothetical protein
MSDESGAFVRGFGDLAHGRGGIAWSLGGGGAVLVEGGEATATEIDTVDPDSQERWSFYTPLDGDPLQGAATFRHIVVEGAEGGTIVCTAVGPPGIAGHSEERNSAALHTPGEDVPYEEALISTQYDAEGDPTRFGLELWPVDADTSIRAAAVRVSGTLLGGTRQGESWAGLFRCHTDGHEGIGSYLLWRG